jgi:hypothetical protein
MERFDTEKFYCLAYNGDLVDIGYHDSWEEANRYAEDDLALQPIWVFGEESANQWRSVLNQ